MTPRWRKQQHKKGANKLVFKLQMYKITCNFFFSTKFLKALIKVNQINKYLKNFKKVQQKK